MSVPMSVSKITGTGSAARAAIASRISRRIGFMGA
jgi:hypothetical protein